MVLDSAREKRKRSAPPLKLFLLKSSFLNLTSSAAMPTAWGVCSPTFVTVAGFVWVWVALLRWFSFLSIAVYYQMQFRLNKHGGARENLFRLTKPWIKGAASRKCKIIVGNRYLNFILLQFSLNKYGGAGKNFIRLTKPWIATPAARCRHGNQFLKSSHILLSFLIPKGCGGDRKAPAFRFKFK